MKLSNLKISTRLAIGFSLLVLGALLLASTGWFGIQRQSQVATVAVDRDVQFLRAVSSIRARVQMLRRYEKDMLLNIERPEKLKEYKGKWDDSRKRLEELLAQGRATAVTAEETTRLESLGKSLSQYGSEMVKVEDAMMSGAVVSAEQAYHKVEEFRQVVRDTESVTQDLFDGANKRIETVKPALAGIAHDVLLVLAIVAAVVVLLAVVIAVLITRSIIRPVSEAVQVWPGAT